MDDGMGARIDEEARARVATSTDLVVAARNERIVRDGFWKKLLRLVGHLPMAETAAAAWFAAMDPQTPWRVKAALLAGLAYFVVPIDLIPDFIAGLGYTDDAGMLAAITALVAANITEEHRRRAREALGKGEAPAV